MGLFAKLAKNIWTTTKLGVGSLSQQSSQINKAAFTIPTHRLKQHKDIQKKFGKSFFTSDLSTNEYLLTREAGCEPVGLVMGTSFYKVGFYGYFWGYRNHTGEVEALTQAQIAVRELAVSRMQAEAAMLGAHGIIGVRLHQRRQVWGMGMVEFTAIGTAIRIPNRPPTNKPFTSDLSGQEFWQLRQAGYWPMGLVFGACSYYVHSDRTTRTLMNNSAWNRLVGQGRRNQELTQFTQGFQDARELAVMRLSAEISQLSAKGAVGMHIEKSEEIITYQPQSPLGCFVAFFTFGLLIACFGAIIAGHGTAAGVSFVLLFVSFTINIIVAVFNNILGNNGPFRDILINFVAIGTAIVEDELPSENPVSKTLIFYPLSQR
ncbi:MAG: heavy metal-binding domain-containing protein [Aulosira sp. ZfuVER01]|nr:heavy metal-binding domain-containing protein [Aulosira sp. ZfuVER01]MDZ8002281.1 heavy metal-binding domain-containing protein [Aulosira sp. DedVER01a]MDZ8052715.1 heavy metal-binding domain-containing protein [Aulosira sp. ZfuCHP01]